MDLIIQSVLPIFALVVLGYSAGRFRWVANVTEKGLADFTFKLAIPALLFKTMATAELPETPPYLIWAAYFGSVLTGWLIMTALVPLLLRRPLVDSAPIAMSACFGNVVMVGIPLCLNAIGPSAAGPIAVIISLHSPVLWTIASTHLAITNRSAAKPFGESVKDLVRDLSRNTIIIAILAGTAWRLTGIGLHPVAENSLAYLGQAAIPCALVSLGLSLVGFQIKGQAPTLTAILIVKLALLPMIAFWISVSVLALPAGTAAVVVIFAAMPTGVNAYLFAVQNGRAMNSASGAIALGTILSVLTASVLTALLTGSILAPRP